MPYYFHKNGYQMLYTHYTAFGIAIANYKWNGYCRAVGNTMVIIAVVFLKQLVLLMVWALLYFDNKIFNAILLTMVIILLYYIAIHGMTVAIHGMAIAIHGMIIANGMIISNGMSIAVYCW